MRKPSICFVMRYHPYYYVGGAEMQAWLFAKELAERGWEAHYVFGHTDPEPRMEIREGVYLHRRKLVRRGLEILGYRALARKLFKIDADIYYQRVALPLTGMVAYFASSHKKKFVWSSSHFHDCIRNKFTMRNNVFAVHKFLLERLNNYLYTYGIHNASLVVSQSRDQYDLLKKYFNTESVVIKNGWPSPGKPTFEKVNPPLVLWVANLKPWKRPELFVELAKKCEDLNAHFLMIGGGERNATESVCAHIRECTNIEFKDSVSFKEVNDFMEEASVFVNTSEHEGFPNTFIQAWMRQTPTVSLHVDPDGVIENKRLGFTSKSFEKLVEDVRLLISDARLREQMGRNACKHASVEHSIKNSTDGFEHCLFELLGK